MAYELPKLPYPYDALEPHIDAQTMEIHYTKHHQTYVNNLNAALQGTPLAETPVDALIAALEKVPEAPGAAVPTNGPPPPNPALFSTVMPPQGGGKPGGALGAA